MKKKYFLFVNKLKKFKILKLFTIKIMFDIFKFLI